MGDHTVEEERDGCTEYEGVRSGMTLFAPVTSLVIVTNNKRREYAHACIHSREPRVSRGLELPDVSAGIVNKKKNFILTRLSVLQLQIEVIININIIIFSCPLLFLFYFWKKRCFIS